MNDRSPLIIALDYDNLYKALSLVDQISPKDCQLKIGKEMFTLFGPKIIRDLHKRGFDVFLDLKFHDIPTTAARAVMAAAELGVWMVNVHALGGEKMMTATREALKSYGTNSPLLIAVTILTSIESKDLQNLGINYLLSKYAERLAFLAKKCGLDGVICSAQEAKNFKNKLGQMFKVVSPGIRPKGSNVEDQRRVMTPEEAKRVGVDYMIIGRPITQSPDPVKVLKKIRRSISEK